MGKCGVDYQVTSNSWTFLEANVAIIVTCLPTLKASFLPCIDTHKSKSKSKSKINNSASNPDVCSSHTYSSKNVVSSHVRSRTVGAGDSEEDFILHDVEPAKVRMTREVDVVFEDKKGRDSGHGDGN